MDKDRAILIVCLFLCLCFTFTVINGDEEEEQKQDTEAATASFWLWQKLRSFYSLYSKVVSPTTWQWQILKESYSRFISPHLGFSRGGDEALRAAQGAAKSDHERKTTSSKKDSQHQNEL